MDHAVTWVTAPPTAPVWAAEVMRVNRRAADLLALPLTGRPVRVGAARLPGGDRGAARPVVLPPARAPTIANLKAALNACMGLDFAAHAGEVVEVVSSPAGPGTLTVQYGATCSGRSDAEGRVVCGRVVRAAGKHRRLGAQGRVVELDDVSSLQVGDWVVPGHVDRPGSPAVSCASTPSSSPARCRTHRGAAPSTRPATPSGAAPAGTPSRWATCCASRTRSGVAGTYRIDQPLGRWGLVPRGAPGPTRSVCVRARPPGAGWRCGPRSTRPATYRPRWCAPRLRGPMTCGSGPWRSTASAAATPSRRRGTRGSTAATSSRTAS